MLIACLPLPLERRVEAADARDRIAQLVFQKVERAEFMEVDVLPGSGRGKDGFGSTGS